MYFFVYPPEVRRTVLPKIIGRACDCVACTNGWRKPSLSSKPPRNVSKMLDTIRSQLERSGTLAKRDVGFLVSKMNNFSLMEKVAVFQYIFQYYFGYDKLKIE